MSNIGFHFIDGNFAEAQRARWLTQLRRIHPRFIVVVVAGQREQATLFVREVRTQCPHTSVIIRHYADGPDEGMWRRIDPADYVRRIGGLYTEQLSDLDGWYLMPDNEFASNVRSEYDSWMAWLALAAKEAHAIGLRMALGCQPTHNPEPDLIRAGWLDVLFHVFKTYQEHIYYRNVYYDNTNRDGLRYVRDLVERMKLVAGYVPPVVIGEFGRLRKITDAQAGYKTTGIDRKALAIGAVSMFRAYLQGLSPLGIYACWYCVGAWPVGHDTFNVADDDAFFDELAKVANEKLPDTAPLPSPIGPEIHDNPAADDPKEPSTPVKPPIDIGPEPPINDEDTVEIPQPDHVKHAEAKLALIQAEADALHSEKDMLTQTYNARMKWLDKRSQWVQAKLLLAEMELEDEKAAAAA